MGVINEKTVRKAIHIINAVVDFAVLIAILLLTAFSGYALWDSNRLYTSADPKKYAIYKPTEENDTTSFEKLQKINPEVFGWLTVYGTNIDYPIVQGQDNTKYVNTNAFGEYSLSGAIFLDCHNDSGFGDFNSILYGHHMDKKAMFGEIGSFRRRDFFDSHRYGNLFYNGTNHGLEFFAFLKTDAYDAATFSPAIEGETARLEYLQKLLSIALYTRNVTVTVDDHILLLTTCSSTAPNKRDILVAKITDQCYENTFDVAGTKNSDAEQTAAPGGGQTPILKFIIPVLAILILALIFALYYQNLKNNSKGV